MKTLVPLTLLPLLALLALDATGQQSNPLKITCPASFTNWICGGSFAFVSYPASAISGSCPTNATVTCTPASGSTFILGPTTVTCRATNACRESAVCSFTITMAHDTMPPVIQCPTNRVASLCGTASTISISFPLPPAMDNADTNVTVTCSPPPGALFPLGTTRVTCTATDNCTNRSTCTFTVNVIRDVVPPVIQCPADLSVATCSNSFAVNYSVTATDDCTGAVTVVCEPPSGSQFPVGTTTVNCTATDSSGNQSACSFTVTVKRGLPILSESEPNNALASAQDFGLVRFVSVVGRISPAGDVDYYRFTAVPNSKTWITVDTGGAAWLGANSRDSVLTLYNGAGAVIESDDNDGSGNGADSVLESGDASAIAGAALSGGTYYLSVAAPAGQIIAPYRLYLTVTTNDLPAEVEANNTAATATTLIPPGLTYGVRNGSINPVGDEDWYTVSVPGPGLVHISVDGDPERDGTGTDTRVELFRMDGVSILFSANSSASGGSVAEGFVYRLSVPGTYYLRVRSGSSSAVTGTYRVMVMHCPLPPLPALGIAYASGRVTLSWPAATEPCLIRSSSIPSLNQSGRTFQDRTYVFRVSEAPMLELELSSSAPHQFFQLVPAGGWSNDTWHCCDANGQNCSEPVDPTTGCPNLVWCHETGSSTVCEPQ